MTTHHLAQLNIARLVSPIDSPPLADFVANLDRINAMTNLHRLQRVLATL